MRAGARPGTEATHTTDERGVRELGASTCMLPLGSCTDSTDYGATCKISDIIGDFFKLGEQIHSAPLDEAEKPMAWHLPGC